LRLNFINIKKQNSFKKRTNHKKKNQKLTIGSVGILTVINFRFEFIYFSLLKRYLKKNLKTKFNYLIQPRVWVNLRSNYPLTRKSKNSRMGKGKGSFLRWSILTYKNQIIVEFLNFSRIRSLLIVKNWNYILSKKLTVIFK
jgi:hypothetical protein